MATIYQIVDTQVYTKQQIATRIISIEHEVAHLGSGVVFKMRLRSGKWYLNVSVDCVGQPEAMESIITAVKKRFTYAYSTSGSPFNRTMRIGSTAKRTAEQIAKERATRRSHSLRTALFESLWSKFCDDEIDLGVDYVSDLVDVIAATVTKHNPK